MYVPGQNAHEEMVSIVDHYKKRIAELETENKRLRKEKASLMLARKMDESYEKEIAALRAEICSMNDAGHKLTDENERLQNALKDCRVTLAYPQALEKGELALLVESIDASIEKSR